MIRIVLHCVYGDYAHDHTERSATVGGSSGLSQAPHAANGGPMTKASFDRLTNEQLERMVLASGSHGDRSHGLCAMEVVAWLAGEKHSDHPECASPVIAAFIRN